MKELIDAFVHLFDKLTPMRVILATALTAALVAIFTLYENRQDVYQGVTTVKVVGDFPLEPPKDDGKRLIQEFVRKHPEVGMVTLIDADPVSNTRRPVYRVYNNDKVKQIITDAIEAGQTGIQPLFNSDPKNNEQMLAIISGEFSCSPVKEGGIAYAFPQIVGTVVMTCRAPLPPAFNKATGWFSIHLIKQLTPQELDKLKFDALSMSLAYYNAEIAERETVRIK